MQSVGQEVIKRKFENETFHLIPNNYRTLAYRYDEIIGYQYLHRYAKEHVRRKSAEFKNTELLQNSKMYLKEILSPLECQQLIEAYDADNDFLTKNKQQALNLFRRMLTPEVDEHLFSYFQSEYTPMWFNIQKSSAEDEASVHAFRWHCDGGPSKHIKILMYLNPSEEHQGNTLFTDKLTTEKLKELGYIFCPLGDRKKDLTPITNAHNLPYTIDDYDYGAGDAVMFAPFEIAHRGQVPVEGKYRYVLVMCIGPSAIPWQDTLERVVFPLYGYCDFTKYMNLYRDAYKKFDQSAVLGPDFSEQLSDYEDSVDGKKVIEVGQGFVLESWEHVGAVLESIFENMEFSRMILLRFMREFVKVDQVNSIAKLLTVLRTSFANSIDWNKPFDNELISNLQKLADYETKLNKRVLTYNVENKPNQQAVFWPNPTHPNKPSSLFDMKPYVKPTPIMDMHTPIGSAGSCFAFEIAQVFQEQGFNFVVTERNDDPNSGIIIDGYKPGDKYAKFSANYGILFNTPSFRQLAEKAFEVKPFRRILYKKHNRFLCDPYRENVFFQSREAYDIDYPKHVEAVRQSLLQSEIFIVTLGLNECWKFLSDGTAISRNPEAALYPLIKHCILSVQENVENIQTFIDIVRVHNPNFKLIVTLSPVPFLASGRGDDTHVVTANCHSKAVLRVAAEELVNNNKDVYYLPSYELVTNCSQDPWKEDQRKVKSDTVDRVVEMFKEMFVTA